MTHSATIKQVSSIKLGHTVRYFDSKGHEKVAIVTGTDKSISEGSQLPSLNENSFALQVFSPSGSHYGKFGVPDFSTLENQLDFTNAEGKPVGAVLPF